MGLNFPRYDSSDQDRPILAATSRSLSSSRDSQDSSMLEMLPEASYITLTFEEATDELEPACEPFEGGEASELVLLAAITPEMRDLSRLPI